MAEFPQQNEPIITKATKLKQAADRPKNKGTDYYSSLKGEYNDFILGNELITVPTVMEAINMRTISFLTVDVKTRKFIAVTRKIPL